MAYFAQMAIVVLISFPMIVHVMFAMIFLSISESRDLEPFLKSVPRRSAEPRSWGFAENPKDSQLPQISWDWKMAYKMCPGFTNWAIRRFVCMFMTGFCIFLIIDGCIWLMNGLTRSVLSLFSFLFISYLMAFSVNWLNFLSLIQLMNGLMIIC